MRVILVWYKFFGVQDTWSMASCQPGKMFNQYIRYSTQRTNYF